MSTSNGLFVGTFPPLVFSCSGGIDPAVTVVYKRLATLISEECGHPYSLTGKSFRGIF